jgi:purine nucleosidase
VYVGAETAFTGAESGSAASAAIIAEARRDDALPLFLVCAGPLTNVAAALAEAPDIAAGMTLVWVGGAVTPETFEYNRDTDPAAADSVFGRPDLAVSQFPVETCRRCAYSVAEREHDLTGSGRVGSWLWDRFVELPLPDWVQQGTDVDVRLVVGDMLAELRGHERRQARSR